MQPPAHHLTYQCTNTCSAFSLLSFNTKYSSTLNVISCTPIAAFDPLTRASLARQVSRAVCAASLRPPSPQSRSSSWQSASVRTARPRSSSASTQPRPPPLAEQRKRRTDALSLQRCDVPGRVDGAEEEPSCDVHGLVVRHLLDLHLLILLFIPLLSVL